MGNEFQPNTPSVQSLPQTPPIVQSSTNWSKILLFIVLVLVIIAVSILFRIQIGKNQTANQQPYTVLPTASPTQAIVNPTVQPTTNPTINPTEDWISYQLSQLIISFKMPLQLNPSKKLNFTTSHSNLYWNDSPNSPIRLSATSVKSTFEGGFSYLNGCIGYKKSDTGYKFLTYTNAEIDMPSVLTKETINQNQVKYLVVKSDPNQTIEGMPPLGITEKGYIAAIINTNNTEYPVIVMQMKLTNDNTESVFNQILSTYKLTN